MLVLDLAGHGSKRAIGDMPGERPAKLARGEPPGGVTDLGDCLAVVRHAVDPVAKIVDERSDPHRRETPS